MSNFWLPLFRNFSDKFLPPATLKTKDTIAAIPPISYFNAYHTFAEHGTFLSDLQAAFPSNSEVFTVGNSFEGRAIRGIHLWGSGGKGSKPAIVWHGTVHAREWITTTVKEALLSYNLTGC